MCLIFVQIRLTLYSALAFLPPGTGGRGVILSAPLYNFKTAQDKANGITQDNAHNISNI